MTTRKLDDALIEASALIAAAERQAPPAILPVLREARDVLKRQMSPTAQSALETALELASPSYQEDDDAQG